LHKKPVQELTDAELTAIIRNGQTTAAVDDGESLRKYDAMTRPLKAARRKCMIISRDPLSFWSTGSIMQIKRRTKPDKTPPSKWVMYGALFHMIF
jgi:hypothetical protein